MQAAVRKIGIGIGADAEKVVDSACRVNVPCDIVCYCRPGTAKVPSGHPRVRLAESRTPETALVSDLMAGAIDAAVRGTLPANVTLQALKVAAGVDHLERIALLETAGGKKFLFAPVGIDEGWTVADKLALIRKGRVIARRFGLPEKVGVLSGGRFGDVGRHAIVDRSMADAELVAKLGDAMHYEILIEDAIESCGLIIAPDGISGNLVFRTLTFLGAGHGHGAPVVNIDRIFVDTSRASPDYTNALLLAASLLE
ncbi:methanogenesis marker protein Mmp4/MtxX [Methanoregula sp.]|jgi:putative methanogen marker protein 4|uniref:methanogenesis marker protein Mmp4/MtxX n=1 Tax=Methanoregula sp. TaxID=2052170 RepID=UPI0025F32790|nr:methanogenesis marker protein Mmp4/MtxX [Methanoregula sp.]